MSNEMIACMHALMVVAGIGIAVHSSDAFGQQAAPAPTQADALWEAERIHLQHQVAAAEARADDAENQVSLQQEKFEEFLKNIQKAAMIDPVPQIEFADGESMMLLEPMAYQIGSTGIEVTVPAGFVHDNASIPRPLWSLLPPHGLYGKAAIVHDYLYWAQPCSDRKQADNLLMLAMIESKVGAATRQAVYRGVRLGGGTPYKVNRKARDNGALKIVPANRRKIPAEAKWADYQAQLLREGARDPAFPPDTGYCALGNSAVVPHIEVED